MSFPEWLSHLGNLLIRSGKTLLSWSGFGIAAILVSAITLFRRLYREAVDSYRKRYTYCSK